MGYFLSRTSEVKMSFCTLSAFVCYGAFSLQSNMFCVLLCIKDLIYLNQIFFFFVLFLVVLCLVKI